GIELKQSAPAPPNAKHLVPLVDCAIDQRFDAGIQPRYIPASGQHSNCLSHDCHLRHVLLTTDYRTGTACETGYPAFTSNSQDHLVGAGSQWHARHKNILLAPVGRDTLSAQSGCSLERPLPYLRRATTMPGV